jgi:hypothetical protein
MHHQNLPDLNHPDLSLQTNKTKQALGLMGKLALFKG